MPHFTHAILRQPGENFHQGLTTSPLGAPDYSLMLEQHAAYATVLQRLGLEILNLPPMNEYPDAYFVEDTAVIVPEIAVIANPGAPERSGEQLAMAPVLSRFRPLQYIQPPGTLDGGDVLIFDKNVFIGLSGRSNDEGAGQLCGFLQPYGYSCSFVAVRAGLHLKSSVGYLGADTLLLTKELARDPAFGFYKKCMLIADEEYAGNVLLINGHILLPQGFPGTRDQLLSLSLPVIELNVSEARKMDGGLSCMSLRF